MGASPLPPPPYWPPPRPSWESPGAIIGIVLGIVFAVFFLFVVLTGFLFVPTGFGLTFLAPVCAVVLIMIVVLVLAASQGWSQRRIPPPPPIQQPMVPAGTQGPVALNCPNCGAPPQAVDRFGVATCVYCNTRYLVR